VSAAKRQQLSKVTLAISVDLDQLAAQTLEYSELSKSEPAIAGVGIDDFHSQLRRWLVARPLTTMSVLARAIRNLKVRNPDLKFGITLYEDDLDGVALDALPNDVRLGIDRVSLYLHYRAAGPDYINFVGVSKQMFPNAQILAGVYAYDRIDYLPCAHTMRRACTAAEEQSLFESTARIQARLIQSRELAGVEYYPGRFGQEADWEGWNALRICSSRRRDECVAQTRRLREIAARLLGPTQVEQGP
jgi:hypothetical protein